MKYHGKLAGVSALVAVLFVGSLTSAGELKNEKIADLQKQIRELREDVEMLRRMRQDDNKLTNAELKLMNERLERIEAMLARRQANKAGTRRSSSFTPGTAAPRVPATGTIRLDNRLAVPATVTIDGTVYTVPAYSMMTLAGQPARRITYEVTAVGYGVRAPVRTPVNPNETLTLTIY